MGFGGFWLPGVGRRSSAALPWIPRHRHLCLRHNNGTLIFWTTCCRWRSCWPLIRILSFPCCSARLMSGITLNLELSYWDIGQNLYRVLVADSFWSISRDLNCLYIEWNSSGVYFTEGTCCSVFCPCIIVRVPEPLDSCDSYGLKVLLNSCTTVVLWYFFDLDITVLSLVLRILNNTYALLLDIFSQFTQLWMVMVLIFSRICIHVYKGNIGWTTKYC
jgi:hypothetical protein